MAIVKRVGVGTGVWLAALLLAVLTDLTPRAGAAGNVATCNETSLNTALTGGGTVTFSCSGTINITSQKTIAANTTIDGTGQTVTIAGNNTFRLFVVNSGVSATFSHLTLTGGIAGDGFGGGAIFNSGTLSISSATFLSNTTNNGGGAVNVNSGSLTVSNSTFSNNTATTASGAAAAIYLNSGTLTISNSTFSSNLAPTAGAIFINGGTATITASTFSSNQAGSGGAIRNGGGTANITNSTFYANTTTGAGGSAIDSAATTNINFSTFSGNSAFSGGALRRTAGTLTVSNSILANVSGSECNGTVANGGYNLASDTSCGLVGNNSQQSVTTNQLALGAIGANGGATQTIPLLPGSIALNAVPNATNGCGNTVNSDQRGNDRPLGEACDIGAYEVNETIVGNGTAPSCTFAALQAAIANSELVTFNCPNPTTIVVTSPLTPAQAVSVDGAGQAITLSGNNANRIFVVSGGVSLNLYNLTLSGGRNLDGGGGGAIHNSGTLTITNSIMSSNGTLDACGGAIFSGGTATISNSTFSGNSAGVSTLPFTSNGGVICVEGGTMNITNAVFSGNAAAGLGGAISTEVGSTTVTNSTFTGHQSAGANVIYNAATTSIVNSTFSGNSANGASTIRSGDGTMSIVNSTLVDWIQRLGGSITVSNSILAYGGGSQCTVSITDGGYNLSRDATCNLTGTGSLQNVTAQQLNLGALANNGGPTQTILPGKGSIAIDRIPAGANCGPAVAATDQRGIARPQRANCDVGAVEIPYRVPPRTVSE